MRLKDYQNIALMKQTFLLYNEKLRGWSYMMTQQFQDGGRPPSWISIVGHNLGVNQIFLSAASFKCNTYSARLSYAYNL